MLLDCLQETDMQLSSVEPPGINPCMFPLRFDRHENSFWLRNIDTINGKVMSPKSSAIGVVYSDASDTGLWLFYALWRIFSFRRLIQQ